MSAGLRHGDGQGAGGEVPGSGFYLSEVLPGKHSKVPLQSGII